MMVASALRDVHIEPVSPVVGDDRRFILRGEALRMQHRYDAAASALRTAAQKFPAPYDRPAWLALSQCYRQVGDMNRAIQSLARARGARPRRKKPNGS